MNAYTEDLGDTTIGANKTLEAFAGIAAQNLDRLWSPDGLASRAIFGASDAGGDHWLAGVGTAQKLEEAATGVFRLGKAVLRLTPESSLENLPAALRQNVLPHCPRTKPWRRFVRGRIVCRPLGDPEELERVFRTRESRGPRRDK